MKVVCISDTHSKHNRLNVPDGDILINAGDLTENGEAEEVKDYNNWLSSLPHRYHICIAGNHDFLFEKEPEYAQSLLTNAIYLQDSSVEIEGIKFWGSPVSIRFYDWAFNRDRGSDIKKHWDLIPNDTDILITHSPPWGILDRTYDRTYAGCEDLRNAIFRVKPKYCIFGHIHTGYGIYKINDITFINASVLGYKDNVINKPVVFEI